MRKIKDREIKLELPPATLDMDDLHELVDTLRGEGRQNTVRIESGDYELDSVDEIKKLRPGSIREFEIQATEGNEFYSPRLTLYLTKHSSWLIVSGELEALRARALEVQELFNRRAVWWRRLADVPLSLWIGLVALLPIITFLSTRNSPKSEGVLILIAIVVLYCLFMGALFRAHSLILPRTRAEKTSFWSRNKDRILVGIVMPLVGFMLAQLKTCEFLTRPSDDVPATIESDTGTVVPDSTVP